MEAPEIKDLHADEELQKLLPDVVKNLNGIPLHVGFSITKWDASEEMIQGWERDAWGSHQVVAANQSLLIPNRFFSSFASTVSKLDAKGVTWGNYQT